MESKKENETSAVMLDLQEAFDIVDHRIELMKLKCVWIKTPTCELVEILRGKQEAGV